MWRLRANQVRKYSSTTRVLHSPGYTQCRTNFSLLYQPLLKTSCRPEEWGQSRTGSLVPRDLHVPSRRYARQSWHLDVSGKRHQPPFSGFTPLLALRSTLLNRFSEPSRLSEPTIRNSLGILPISARFGATLEAIMSQGMKCFLRSYYKIHAS
jgi:hypothetical protein